MQFRESSAPREDQTQYFLEKVSLVNVFPKAYQPWQTKSTQGVVPKWY